MLVLASWLWSAVDRGGKCVAGNAPIRPSQWNLDFFTEGKNMMRARLADIRITILDDCFATVKTRNITLTTATSRITSITNQVLAQLDLMMGCKEEAPVRVSCSWF